MTYGSIVKYEIRVTLDGGENCGSQIDSHDNDDGSLMEERAMYFPLFVGMGPNELRRLSYIRCILE